MPYMTANNLPEIRFYHLTASSLERALPPLVEKILASGQRTLIKTADEIKMDRLNELLWTFNPNSFLPHGSRKDGNEGQQPIFITDQTENLNQSTILVITDGSLIQTDTTYTRILDMFDGTDIDAVQAARTRWKQYKEKGFTLEYWQQSETGGWVKNA